MGDRWFEDYDGQSTGDLLALGDEFRVDSLVLAFETAIENKSPESSTSREERFVLAIEALEREVNNGGYRQFFDNCGEFIDVIVDALLAIGCPLTAALTARAIRALGGVDDVPAELDDCDREYLALREPIADRLFVWIGTNAERVRIGDA